MTNEITATLPKNKHRQSARHTLGFILRDFTTINFDVPMWASVVNTADELDVNLITYMTHPMWYSQEGLELNLGIYQQINPEVIDGLLSADMGLPWVSAKLAHYAKYPNVVLAYPAKGFPSVVLSQEGMSLAVDHLIEVHRKSRILYISGNKGNQEAEARLAAYKRSLSSHQIMVDPDLIFYGDFGNVALAEAIIAEAIDQKHLKFDAVVCANDLMAVAAINALQKHHLSVPYDIPVTGFDDEVKASSGLPTLTTIRASFGAITRLGIQRLLQVVNHEPVPAAIETYPTELIVRQSCGCLPKNILMASSKHFKPQKGIVLNVDFLQMNQVMADNLGPLAAQLPENWQKDLWDAFIRSLKSSKPKAFIQQLDILQRKALVIGITPDQWQMVISVMRNYAVNTVSNQIAGLAQQVEDLFNQGRIYTAEMAKNLSTRDGLEKEDMTTRLLDTIQMLLNAFTMDGLMNLLSSTMPANLHIPAVYLALYEGHQWPPQNARLIVAYNQKQGRVNLGEGGLVFPAQQVLPKQFFPTGRRFHLITAPLYFQNENLGFIVFEAGPIDYIYSSLQKLIAGALKGALLYQQRDDLLKNIAKSAQHVADSSTRLEEIVDGTKEAMNQISKSMNQIAIGASDQAGIVNKAVYSIDTMTTASQKIASEARAGNDFAAQAARDAQIGAKMGNATVQGMQEIKEKVGIAADRVKEMSQRSLEISAIVETIDDIARQTNLLALNAAIEAARAGEQGRGFAVVASEVRKLSERTNSSTREIAALITTIQQTISEAVKAIEISSQQVSEGSLRVNEANQSVVNIEKAAGSLYQRVQAISGVAEEIAGKANAMTASIEDIASVSEENTAATEEVNASADAVNGQMEEMAGLSRSLAEMARSMQELVSKYQ